MDHALEIILLQSPQRESASRLLTDAFMADPLYRMVQPDPGRRRNMLDWLHDRVLRYTLMKGQVLTTTTGDGVACWLPPGEMELSIGGIIRSGLIQLPFRLGLGAYRRFNSYMQFSARHRKQQISERYWYLWVIGVDPGKQGQGIGGRLVRPVLERADQDQVPIFLETEKESNLGFYEKQGFRPVVAETVSGSDVMMWSMIRRPQKRLDSVTDR